MIKVAFHTLGCRLNQAETAELSGRLVSLGFEVTCDISSANVVIIHSCAITHAAEAECLRIARREKRRGPAPLVVFTGCAAVSAGQEALTEAGVDLVVPQSEKKNLPQILAARFGLDNSSPEFVLPIFGTTRAPVKIQDGCDFRCSYCIVPDARGKPLSRDFVEIVDEAAGIASKGYREIVLTGVNIGCYRSGNRRLADLVESIIAAMPEGRVRLGSLEPGTEERNIVDLMLQTNRLCRFLHMPLQSGNAGILRAMRRRYNPDQYSSAVQYAVERIPDIAVGADIITGFPGESEEAFKSTVDMVNELPFSNLHVFPYSERPGTPAASMQDKVPIHVRRLRARTLMTAGDAKREAFKERFKNKTVDVLVETVDHDGLGHGWTGEYLEAVVPGLSQSDIGHIISTTYFPAKNNSVYEN